jgi:uncharacterized repeat protein (TIGR02543 family)
MIPNDSSSATGPVTSSKTVSVTFVKQIHHVFYNANGGSGNVPSDNANYSIGDSVIVKSDIPTRDGFTFAGWTLDSGNSGAVYSAGQSITFGATDITFYAKWAVTKFQLNYSASTGGSISGVNPQTVDYGVDGSEVIATPDLHYHFTGWSDSVITPSRRELNVTRNVSVTASFSINSNTVTYNGNGNDTGIAPMDPVSHDYSTAVTVFIGWNTAANGSGTTFAENSTFNIGDAPVVLYAQWRALPSNGGGGGVAIENYQITYKSGGGVGTTPNGPTTYAYGTPFNLPENTFARIGHQFIGWTEDISHRIYKARDTFPATQGNVSFTATWSRNTYSISYAPGDGVGEGPKEPTKFIYGDNFSLPKCEADCYTRTGYTFTGWNDGNNTYKPEDIYTTSTSNLIFTAIWSQEIAPIVITPGTPKITIKTLPSYTNHAVKYASVKAHYEVVDTTAHTYNLGVVHDKGSSLRFTEDVIKSVDGKLIFKVTDTGIAVTAINGWTGKITVPAVAVRDNQEIELFIGITENPGAVLKPVINVNNVKQEVITWKKDGSQVVGYVVTNGAKTICKTTSLKCTINNGTNGTLNIKIKALGRDNTASVSVKPDVTPNNFKVLFNTNSYTITAQYQAVLKNVIRIAKLVGATKFVITGHTDSIGSKSANQKLSENRASAVQKYISASIKKASFKWNGFADSTPAASNNSVAGQAANRRVEVKIS